MDRLVKRAKRVLSYRQRFQRIDAGLEQSHEAELARRQAALNSFSQHLGLAGPGRSRHQHAWRYGISATAHRICIFFGGFGEVPEVPKSDRRTLMTEQLDLTDEETRALIALLRELLEYARFPLAPRLGPLRAILAKLEPPAPLPAGRGIRRR